MKSVLVTGANGQLAKCFEKIQGNFPDFQFHFIASSSLDITSEENLKHHFEQQHFDYVINCAAYTNVEKAEAEREKAFLVNAEAVKKLANLCHLYQATLIHFSTDYVFNGESKEPYVETDTVDPINVYGASKLRGEQYISQELNRYFIFRTSWLYSEFGHNFFRTMLKKTEEKDVELKITTEQTGTPTNANDLAAVVMKVISEGKNVYGLYHFSNEGEATWYDFAKAIFENAGELKNVNLKASSAYKTVARRPIYSVLNKEKAVRELKIEPKNWKQSLAELQKEG